MNPFGDALQLFGPCAVPFAIEKQTLLKLALMKVVEEDLNLYLVNISSVSLGLSSRRCFAVSRDFLH
jgi:hypothetical protein